MDRENKHFFSKRGKTELGNLHLTFPKPNVIHSDNDIDHCRNVNKNNLGCKEGLQ